MCMSRVLLLIVAFSAVLFVTSTHIEAAVLPVVSGLCFARFCSAVMTAGCTLRNTRCELDLPAVKSSGLATTHPLARMEPPA